ncbi:DUF6456 domain-containing protein [Afifella sp. IM 167]|uniref:DUF6456 domain-containing protein n=1 Tax=Afifella sp. IM 167 TaxID=2033586 RepID=UPI001CCF4D19
MKIGASRPLCRLLSEMLASPGAQLVEADGGVYRLEGAPQRREVSLPLARRLLAEGLLSETEGGRLAANAATSAFLRREAGEGDPFLAQHKRLGEAEGAFPAGAPRPSVDLDESPIGALARRSDADGRPYLGPALVEAAERLRRDFERAGLQPRVTANWEASLKAARRTGERGGRDDLGQAALDAKSRLAAALKAVGPELEGVLVDVCCFLKGLEVVERERGFPARSCKLVLKLALMALARHYGLEGEARGPKNSRMRHWGGENYRPSMEG